MFEMFLSIAWVCCTMTSMVTLLCYPVEIRPSGLTPYLGILLLREDTGSNHFFWSGGSGKIGCDHRLHNSPFHCQYCVRTWHKQRRVWGEERRPVWATRTRGSWSIVQNNLILNKIRPSLPWFCFYFEFRCVALNRGQWTFTRSDQNPLQDIIKNTSS